jgi:hypothetical protein
MPNPLLAGSAIALAVAGLVSLVGKAGRLRSLAAVTAGWLAAWWFTGEPWAGFAFSAGLGVLFVSRLQR